MLLGELDLAQVLDRDVEHLSGAPGSEIKD